MNTKDYLIGLISDTHGLLRNSVKRALKGVDLIIRVNVPEKPSEYELHGGLPRPRQERAERAAVSVSVVDWVTGETLWHADLLDRKPKKNEPEPPAGPRTRIFTRCLTSEQLAHRITEKVRQYVSELEKPSAASAPARP